MITNDPKILLARYQIALEGGLVDAINEAIKGTNWEAAELLAIGSRETGFLWGSHWGKFHDWAILGDSSHGHGVFQIDDRSHAEFTNTTLWRAPEPCAVEAIKILDTGAKFLHSFGDVEQAEVWNELVFSAYNCGPRNAWLGYKNHGDPSIFTTDHDYGKDVLGQVEIFGKIMEGA